MTKKVDTWMPFLIDKYLGDTTHLTTEQHGAYMLLLLTMWKRGGDLPSDDAQLAAISRLPLARWRVHRGVILAFFSVQGGVLTQKRLAMELEAANFRSDRASASGKKGAVKRWQLDGKGNGTAIGTVNGTANGSEDGKAIAEDIANGKQEAWLAGSSISIPTTDVVTETASAVSARGLVGKALKAAGLDMARVNTDDPRLMALIDQGATPAEFEGIAREAVAKGIASPLGWICAALQNRRAEAAAITLSPGGPPQQRGPAAPNVTVPSDEAERTQQLLREQSARRQDKPSPEVLKRIAAIKRVGA